MATKLTYKKDPMDDTKAVIGSMKGFKGASSPSNQFKNSKPRTATDAFYQPHQGKVKK